MDAVLLGHTKISRNALTTKRFGTAIAQEELTSSFATPTTINLIAIRYCKLPRMIRSGALHADWNLQNRVQCATALFGPTCGAKGRSLVRVFQKNVHLPVTLPPQVQNTKIL